ncbi:MAG TPA: FAD-binding oxidoreductase [Thermomicrobiaceae bacterium]|nr:FAD-binding oxidoreductase [Thermomicrobiaceae bacterium]
MSTVSLWQDTAVWPALPHRFLEADVCVVGAGIVGSTLATFLARAGKSVIVLEARDVALGASGRNAGFVCTLLEPDYHRQIETLGPAGARERRELGMRNRAILKGFLDDYGVWYEQRGSMILAVDEAEARELAAAAAALQRDGYPVERFERDPTGHGFSGAVYEPGDLATQPYWLVTEIMAHSGATVVPNCAVWSIEQGGDGVVVHGQRAGVRAAQVCLCTNAYSPTIHPYFAGKVAPKRAQMLATSPVPRFLDVPVSAEYGYQYFRQLPDGRFLLGGLRNRFLEQEVGYNDAQTSPELQRGLEEFIAEHFPELRNARVERRWSGIMGFSPDGLPLVGRLPDLPDVYFAVGFSGEGMGIGAATAERAAALMLHGADPGIVSAARLMDNEQGG